MIIVTLSFSKNLVSICFTTTLKQKAGVFEFLLLEERFRKASVL